MKLPDPMNLNLLVAGRTARPGSLPGRVFPAVFGGLVLALLLGCKPPVKEAPELAAPKVEGESVILAEGAPQKSSLAVESAALRKATVTRLTGRLFWNDEATVRIYTPVAGRVANILAGLGQTVTVGASLAKIDSPDFGQALADARTAEANLRLAERSLARSQDLAAHGAAPQKDVESAEAAFITATSERDRSRARLALYGGSDHGTNELYLLRSPLAGVVVEKNLNPGQEVRSDMMLANATQFFAPLFVVSDPTKLWVQLDVSESDVVNLKPGATLRVFARAYPDKVFTGRLENIGDSLDPATRTVKVRGVVDNPDKLLKAEMYVSAEAVTELADQAGALVEISAKAIFTKDNHQYLFVEQTPGHYARKAVKTGTESNGRTLITEGLKSGDKVVVEGSLLLEAVLEATDTKS